MRPRRLLAALAVAALAPRAPLAAAQDAFTGARVTAEVVDGDAWCTVRAENAPIERILGELCAALDLDLEGFREPHRLGLVTVDLRRRPLRQVLEYVAGSLGLRYELRPGVLSVMPDEGPGRSRQHLFDHARAAYQQATFRFASHPEAPSARLQMGILEEARGDDTAAIGQYETLVTHYPSAEEVPLALLRSGLAMQRLDRWSQAAAELGELARHPDAGELASRARLELARCTIRLGDPQTAEYVLNTLERDHATADLEVRARRLLVRAEALAALERHAESLAALDLVHELPLPAADRRRTLGMRAVAFEGLDRFGEAGRAWLAFASEAPPAERPAAWEHAARLALLDGDEVGVLFVHGLAEEAGEGGRTRAAAREARLRLGLTHKLDPETTDEDERLTLAERWLDEERYDRASAALAPLAEDWSALAEPVRARAAVAWALCRNHELGVEAGLAVLREVRGGLGDAELRARVDVAAARLLERHGLFVRAIDAYEGRY